MELTRRNLLYAAAAAQGLGNAAEGDFYRRLVRANDDAIPGILRESPSPRQLRFGIRGTGVQIETLTAAFCAPESTHHRAEALIAPLEQACQRLLKAQHPDGTIDAGNLNSPPDTGFVIESVGRALTVLRRTDDARLDKSRDSLGKFLLSAGEAQATGGIHTPNHRWVVCAALAYINSLFPNAKYVNRIDEWLAEGIYIDADGQFAERSTGIYSQVTDSTLSIVARLLKRPQLLEPVRRNLTMNVFYMHPDGDVETVASRRQDAGQTASIARYYLQYRYLAIHDNNRLFAGITDMMERTLDSQILRSNPVLSFLEDPLLRRPLPASDPIPSDYVKVFANSGVARIRHGKVSATVFGGSDWPLGVASGLSSNPTFFTYRNGSAVLESVRMGCNFFSLGVFRSEGVKVENGAYVLHQRLDAPYYQPLPASERNPRGDYPLTPVKDERYWSKLNFPKRAMSNVQTVDQKVTVAEKDGGFELRFDISGHEGVPVTIELAFRSGGKLSGVEEDAESHSFFLKEGTGKYTAGTDTIEFGPGEHVHRFISLEGHTYRAHNGSLKPAGQCVYITGVTPFQRTLRIR